MTDTIPQDGMTIDVIESLDDGNTVGLAEIEPGGETVSYQDARQAFATVGKRPGRNHYEVGDEDSTIFISSDGGELDVNYGPEFAPIETQLHVWQYELAMEQLEGHYPQFDLCFDDAGLIAFIGEDTTVAVAPIIFPWDKPQPQTAPCGPGGPTV